jgi:ABC-type transport system involved in cytochrome c biogenesis permease subunit
MAVVSFVLVVLGVGLIILGAVISVADWNRRHKPTRGKVITEGTSLGETLEGLAKLADALKHHKLGMQLIIAGIVVLIIAGIFGGVAQLA